MFIFHASCFLVVKYKLLFPFLAYLFVFASTSENESVQFFQKYGPAFHNKTSLIVPVVVMMSDPARLWQFTNHQGAASNRT